MSTNSSRNGLVIVQDSSDTTLARLGASYTVTAYENGAVANGAQSGVSTVTVHAGHGVAAADKIMVGVDESTFRLVDSVTSTTIVLDSGTLDVDDDELIVNLGPDTGSTSPNYDGSGVT